MKIFAILLLSALVYLQANAQKLPQVQPVSLRAPANVKIDGKAIEWGDKLQAYNPKTQLFYTIANDDKRLYLIVQTNDENVVTNIFNGGVRINIQKKATKSDAGAMAVKFPFFEKKKGAYMFSFRRRGKFPAGGVDQMVDSLARYYNSKLGGLVKWIYTNGIKNVPNVLPVYNEQGIEAANAFDKKNYTIELAVDLALLGLSAGESLKFTYHIIANSEPNKFLLSDSFGPDTQGKYPDGSPMPAAKVQQDIINYVKPAADVKNATTDFWGEYTLAK